MRLLVANVTRWSASWRGLLASDAAVWCVQEARLHQDEVEPTTLEARRRGLRLQPGPAHEGQHLLATAHRLGACEVRAAPMAGLSGDRPGRLQHAAIFLGSGRVLHVLNCYGYAGGRADLERNTALVLEGLTWLQGLGGAPALLVGDLNCRLADTGLEGPMAMAGWSDLLALAGPTCLPSQGAPSRIDYALANREARSLVCGAGLRWDLGLASHGALEVEFRLATPERAFLRRGVPALAGPAVEAWSPAAAAATTAALTSRHEPAFRAGLAEGDLDRAWAALELAMRAWLSARLGHGAPLPRPHAAVAWQAERPPTSGGGGEAAHAAADAALLRLRRLRGLRHAQGRAHPDAQRVAQTTLRALRAADAQDPEWSVVHEGLRASDAVASAVLDRAEAAWQQERLAALSARRAAWTAWVQDAAANAQGRLYRWIRDGGALEEELVPDPAAGPAAQEPGPSPASGQRSWLLALRGGPAARLRFFEGPWRELWQRPCAAAPGEEWLQTLDGLPPFPERVPWTGGLVRALLRRMPRRKKPGLDAWTVAELRLLPDELLEWVAELFEAVEARGAWPQHLREPEGLLLPKPGGGGDALDRRPIWLLPILYRVWAAGRAQLLARWRLSWAGAEVGYGAEELAWELALELEAAEALEEGIAGTALDWRKAYDHVGLASAQALLTRAGVPAWLLQPAFSAYSARRRLRVGRALGGPWQPTSGLLPGCALAVFFLSVLTLPWLRRTGAIDDRLRRRIYVDDLTVWMRGPAAEAGEAVAAAMAETLAFEQAMDWRLNRGKSAQFANRRDLRRWLRLQHPEVGATTGIRDLGVVATAGPARRCPVSGARVRLAAGRFARVGRLPLPFRQRCLMGAAAGTAAGLYGAACGRPPARELAGLRAAARLAVCRGGLRSAAEVVFGVLSPSWRLDPEAVVVLAPLWQVALALRRGRFPEALWRETAGAWRAGSGRGAGPVAAALASLQRLGLGGDAECWTGVPEAPQGWRPSERALPDTRRVLLAAWGRAEAARLAQRRAAFEHLEVGVDRWASRRLLESGALDAEAAGALRVVLAGGVVTETVAAKWGRPARCPHCGAAQEDLEHRLWRCPRWEPQRLAALRACDGAAPDVEALRRRLPPGVARTGLLPQEARLAALAAAARCAEAPQPPPAAPPPEGLPRRRAWTDGACLHPTDPLVARAGWGLLLEGASGAAGREHSGAVSGLQTAQRAELTAAVEAARLAGGAVEIVTDSRYVANGVAALRGGANLADWAHADLWALIAPQCRSGALLARWVKGHTTAQEAVARRLAAEDRAGNAQADALAGRAAQARLPPQPLLEARAAVLADLAAAQRVIAAVELAAICANRAGDRDDARRVPRRRLWQPRRRLPPRDGAAPTGRGGPAPARAERFRPAAPAPADACRALFAGRAWQPHVAAQGPGFAVCLACGASAPTWRHLAARPCAGWAPALAPRAAAVLLLPDVACAGGDAAAFPAALQRRLQQRPRAPD